MKIYADSPGHLARQVVTDVAFVAWLVLWVWVGLTVHDATMELTGPGQQVTESASGIAEAMTEAGGTLGSLPVVGDEARTPFDKASGAADRLVDSGHDLDLFALRALTHQPLHVLARISDDPAGAWRAGDRAVTDRLAELELRASGLRLPPGRSTDAA